MLTEGSVRMMFLLYRFGYFVGLFPWLVEVAPDGNVLKTKLVHCLKRKQQFRYIIHKILGWCHVMSKVATIVVSLYFNRNSRASAKLQIMFFCAIQLLALPALLHPYLQDFMIVSYRNAVTALNLTQLGIFRKHLLPAENQMINLIFQFVYAFGIIICLMTAPTYVVTQRIEKNEAISFLSTGSLYWDITIGIIWEINCVMDALGLYECVLSIVMHVDFTARSFRIMKTHLERNPTTREVNLLGLLYRAHQVLHRFTEEAIKLFLPFLLAFSATLLTLTLSIVILYSHHFKLMLIATIVILFFLTTIFVGLALEMGHALTVASTNFIDSFKRNGLREDMPGINSKKLLKCYVASFVGLKWHIIGVHTVHKRTFIVFMNRAVIDNVINIVLAFQT